LSYGANIGYGSWTGSATGITAVTYDYTMGFYGAGDHTASSVDWNGSAGMTPDPQDKQVARATGVFWFPDATDQFRMSLDAINQGDGTGSTILLLETLNIPQMQAAGSLGFNPSAFSCGVGLSMSSVGLLKAVPPAQPTLYVNAGTTPPAQYQFFKPNSNRGTIVGNWPAASSLHPGVVNVVYADGHAGSLSQDINWAVYASLHSPTGVRNFQVPISDSSY
jgi:prepilin-type processing-associated H-X9-DG protein